MVSLKQYNRKKSILIGGVLLGLVIVLFLILSQQSNPQVANIAGQTITNDSRQQVLIGRQFEFKAVNAKKDKKAVKFTVESAERSNEIKVKGEPKKLSKDRNYLLVKLDIENSFTEKLAISPVDYIRLETTDGKKYAPDYHNGNVVLDPISTRKDLVSFIVNKSENKFVLHVGELDQEKQKIEINF